jgi:hypothetical protein
MFKKEKIIKFYAGNEVAEEIFSPPTPATNNVPEWFKNTKKFTNGYNDSVKALNDKDIKDFNPFPTKTFKSCIPITDSITLGYTLKSTATVFVKNIGKDDYIPDIQWKTSYSVGDFQSPEVLGQYPVPTGYSNRMFRWHSYWKIETPPGYSCLITHPIHRNDLPFFTVSAVVDTDKHPNFLVLPSFIKTGFTGFIEVDTPIAQILPFKRDDWKSEINKFNESMLYGPERVFREFERAYKKRWWSKKTFR